MVTSNAAKAEEVAAFFHGALEIDHVAIDIPEHRSDDVSDIAREKARYAFRQLNVPIIVDDTGLFIHALNGFPGPYAAYVQHTLGNNGILSLMDGKSDRSARFITAISYADRSGILVFSGTLEGKIAIAPRGCNGFGYDPVFEVGSMTLAELSMEEKSRMSHRARALTAFHDWFMKERYTGSA